MTDTPKAYHYVAVQDNEKHPIEQVTLHFFETDKQATAFLTGVLAGYGVPYEVWRALHGIQAEEALPYMRQGVCIHKAAAFLDKPVSAF